MDKVMINADTMLGAEGEADAAPAMPADAEQPSAKPSAAVQALSKMSMSDLAGKDAPALAEGETGTPPEEAEGEPDTFETEGDLLKARIGVENYGSLRDFVEAEIEAPFAQLKQILEFSGYKTEAKNYAELNAQLISELMKQSSGGAQAPAADQAQPPQPAADPVITDVNTLFERYQDRLDPDLKPVYGDLAAAISNRQSKALNDVQSRMQVLSDVTDLMLAQTWYNSAVAQAGDDPVPTFAEARAMMRAAPQGRDAALFRLMQFGDASVNPMGQIFSMWRSNKVPGGLSAEEAARRNASAKKIAIMKGMLKATPPARQAAKPRTLDENRAFLEGLDFDSLR